MKQETKNLQLQIRVSKREKEIIRRAASKAGVDLSTWILGQALSPKSRQFEEIVDGLNREGSDRFALAELHDLLSSLTLHEWKIALQTPPRRMPEPLIANQMAAMIEHTAEIKGIKAPQWIRDIKPLQTPYFASSLASLRLHLLVTSPPAFRRRNLFVDTTVGGRV